MACVMGVGMRHLVGRVTQPHGINVARDYKRIDPGNREVVYTTRTTRTQGWMEASGVLLLGDGGRVVGEEHGGVQRVGQAVREQGRQVLVHLNPPSGHCEETQK